MVVSKNLDHDPWAVLAKKHWKTFRPKMYSALVKSGQLEDRLRTAVENAQEQFIAYTQAGMDPFEAEREAKIDYLLLPTEEDQPLLGEDYPPRADPANLITIPRGRREK